MGLGYLASVVREMGMEVKILDCLLKGWEQEEDVDELLIRVGLSDVQIKKYIEDFNPDIVGVNCQFSRQYKIYHQMFSLIKKTKPGCVTIAGGAHVTVCPNEVLKDENCDFIIIGEGENSFKELISLLSQDKDVSGIDGIGYKKNGVIKINEKLNWITDLDSVPFPAYDIMELDEYFGLPASHGMRHKKRFCPVITSRGCPAKCTFCTALKVWGIKYRFRSVENVIREMKLLKDKYKIEEIMFEDDNVTANPRRAKELFRAMIKEKLDFIWDTPNGVGIWSMDEEMLDLMKESGCIKLNFPVESGVQGVLDSIIKKPIKLNRVRELIKYCKKIGLEYSMFLVIGMPGETLKDMWQSFLFAASCGCYYPHVSVATPYPGSQLFLECKENNYFARPFTLDDLFIRSYLIRTPDWDAKQLNKILERGLLYLRIMGIIHSPASIFGMLIKIIKNPMKFLNMIKKGIVGV
ncbi:MAG: radical SAM protein [Elusimicrobia bacterium]|nr:radical SAM protein [Elusimicrobiota bacterium]